MRFSSPKLDSPNDLSLPRRPHLPNLMVVDKEADYGTAHMVQILRHVAIVVELEFVRNSCVSLHNCELCCVGVYNISKVCSFRPKTFPRRFTLVFPLRSVHPTNTHFLHLVLIWWQNINHNVLNSLSNTTVVSSSNRFGWLEDDIAKINKHPFKGISRNAGQTSASLYPGHPGNPLVAREAVLNALESGAGGTQFI